MNGFWIGMMAFPLATAALALAVGSVLWAWDRWAKWTAERVVNSPAPVLPHATKSHSGGTLSTLANLNGRNGLAQLVLTTKKARLIALGSDTGIILVTGKGPFTHDEELVFASALKKSIQDLGEELSLRDSADAAVSKDGDPDKAHEKTEQAGDEA